MSTDPKTKKKKDILPPNDPTNTENSGDTIPTKKPLKRKLN